MEESERMRLFKEYIKGVKVNSVQGSMATAVWMYVSCTPMVKIPANPDLLYRLAVSKSWGAYKPW